MSKITNPFNKFEKLKSLDVADESKLKDYSEELLALDTSTAEKVLEFQKKRDLLEKHLVNEWAESNFLMITDVASEKKKKRLEHFNQVIGPSYEAYNEKLNQKFLKSKAAQDLKPPYNIYRRNLKLETELFREENIELNKEIAKISDEITEMQGKLTANWKGTALPVPQIFPYLESTDRNTRKEAYDSIYQARDQIADILDDKFNRLLDLRQMVAKNAGFESYTPFRFKELKRFDWNEIHCFEFHKAIKKFFLPLREKLLEQRKDGLQINILRPYDIGCDYLGRKPLRIYDKENMNTLIDGTEKIIKAIDDELYNYFSMMKANNLLDLDSRKNKAPGGYMSMYPIFEQASVFYNGAGMAQDLMVLLHELGHCFHYFLGKDVTPYALQLWSPEVGEAGSISMEFIGLENLYHFLDKENCKRMKDDRLRETVFSFAFVARVDEFQHWLYGNPGHSVKMRRDKWWELTETYLRGIDFRGYEDIISKSNWQFSHILQMPFYFLDYAISELLALTIWDNYKTDKDSGLKHYKEGCALAASKTVPEIYEAFGTILDFGENVIAPLAKRLESELL